MCTTKTSWRPKRINSLSALAGIYAKEKLNGNLNEWPVPAGIPSPGAMKTSLNYAWPTQSGPGASTGTESSVFPMGGEGVTELILGATGGDTNAPWRLEKEIR